MKKIHVAGALAVGFALIAGGCQKPIPASYSPDGKALAYVKKGQLVLNSSGRESIVANTRPDSIAWSPDGAYFAWSVGGRSVTNHRKPESVPDEIWILDVARGRKAKSTGVDGPLGWLNGDLVGVDVRGRKPQLATMDPDSGQIRTEVEIDRAPSELTPGTNRRELYVGGSDQLGGWSMFDGLHLTHMSGTDGTAPVSLGARETAFLAGPQRLPLREVKISRWSGDHLEQAVLLKIPDRAGRRHGISIMPFGVVASADLGVVATSVITARGSVHDETELVQLMRKYNVTVLDDRKLPKAIQAEVHRLTDQMKFGELVFCWGTDGERRLIAEYDNSKEFHQIAIDPSGQHLALCGDKGVKIVPLN